VDDDFEMLRDASRCVIESPASARSWTKGGFAALTFLRRKKIEH
jgi:hypothetical protein